MLHLPQTELIYSDLIKRKVTSCVWNINYSLSPCGKFFLVVSMSFALTQLLSSNVLLGYSLSCSSHLICTKKTPLDSVLVKKTSKKKKRALCRVKHTGTNYTDIKVMVRIETLISPVLLLVKSGLIQKVKKRSYKNHSLHWDIEVASKNDIFTTLAHIHSMFYPNLDLLAVANPAASELLFSGSCGHVGGGGGPRYCSLRGRGSSVAREGEVWVQKVCVSQGRCFVLSAALSKQSSAKARRFSCLKVWLLVTVCACLALSGYVPMLCPSLLGTQRLPQPWWEPLLWYWRSTALLCVSLPLSYVVCHLVLLFSLTCLNCPDNYDKSPWRSLLCSSASAAWKAWQWGRAPPHSTFCGLFYRGTDQKVRPQDLVPWVRPCQAALVGSCPVHNST